MLERLAAILASLAMAVPATASSTSVDVPVDRAFPVRGATDYAQAHHDYPATDVFASCGRKAVSPVDGVVLELSRKDRWDPATNRGAPARRQVRLDPGP